MYAPGPWFVQYVNISYIWVDTSQLTVLLHHQCRDKSDYYYKVWTMKCLYFWLLINWCRYIMPLPLLFSLFSGLFKLLMSWGLLPIMYLSLKINIYCPVWVDRAVQNLGPIKTLNTKLLLHNKKLVSGGLSYHCFLRRWSWQLNKLLLGGKKQVTCVPVCSVAVVIMLVYCWGRIQAWTIRIDPLLYAKLHALTFFPSFECFGKSEATCLIHYKACEAAFILFHCLMANSSQEKFKMINIIHKQHI